VRALVAVVFVVAACDEPAALAPPPRPPPRVQSAAARTALDECRDSCEQNAIVAQSPDSVLRDCRARCDGRYGAPAMPHEVPSRITRSAPAHAAPAVRPR
jgi:hypothetical protein